MSGNVPSSVLQDVLQRSTQQVQGSNTAEPYYLSFSLTNLRQNKKCDVRVMQTGRALRSTNAQTTHILAHNFFLLSLCEMTASRMTQPEEGGGWHCLLHQTQKCSRRCCGRCAPLSVPTHTAFGPTGWDVELRRERPGKIPQHGGSQGGRWLCSHSKRLVGAGASLEQW